MKDSTTLLRSQCDALRHLLPEDFMKSVLAIWDYEMDGTEPTDPVAAMAVGMARPIIDKRNKKADAGRIGGSKTKQTEADGKQTEANVKQTEADAKQTEAKEERRKIKDKRNNNKNILSGKPDCAYQYAEVIDYLNAKAGTMFKDQSKDTRSHIKARFDEGFTLDDFKTVIDKKVLEWKNTDMAKYLRPATLFGTKFESYLNQHDGHPQVKSISNFQHSGTDWDDIADQIMNKGVM